MNIDFTEGVRAVYGCVYTMPTFPFITIGLVPSGIKNVKVFQDTFERPFGNQFGDDFFLLEGLVLFRM